MLLRIVRRAAGLGLLACALLAAPAASAPLVDGHFPVSSFNTNSKIVQGSDGNVWLTLSDAVKDVARITPAGEVTEFDLGAEEASGIASDPDGNLWITQKEGVTRFSPADPEGTGKATAIGDVKTPASIVAGPDGQMWIATSENVVHFPPAEPAAAKSIPVAKLNPKDIDVAGSLLVIADSANSRIVTITTDGATQDFPLLGTTTTAQGVAGGPGGQIAFSKSDGTEGLGLLTPPGPPTAVGGPGDPFGVALGPDGAYWFAMSAANNLQRLTPDGIATPLDGFPPKFFPRQIAAGPGNTLWVTMEIPGEDVYEVARVSGVDPPAVPISAAAPRTRIGKGPKGRVRTKRKRAVVKFRFSSPDAGARFECALTKLKKPKGKKGKGKGKVRVVRKPVFKPCKSPRTYRLKPGRYRFEVRAVLAGVADPSPAKRTFRVIRRR